MSITSTGVAGYKYQYDVTVWLTLSWREYAPLSVTVETGQEDATFCLTVDDVQRTIEVQMKSERGPVSEARIAEWLAHFPAQEDTNCLLEQLRDTPSLSVLFVLASATTAVGASLCISHAEEALGPRTKAPLSHADAHALLDAFAKTYKRANASPIEARRHSHCSSLARSMKSNLLRDIARRVFVLPQQERGLVHTRVTSLLNRNFLVPQTRVSPIFEL